MFCNRDIVFICLSTACQEFRLMELKEVGAKRGGGDRDIRVKKISDC